jgi:SAM-dependent methyltransferase
MDVKTAVKEKYSAAARMAAEGQRAACGPSAETGCGCDPITSNLYGADEAGQVPESAMRASLGCGNPTALAALREGEVVLDLGSGGGIDVLLSARRVGPTGKAYGLDATDEMLALAEANKRESGLTNVEFLRGDIEQIPLPDAVINLSADKERVLREAFRVLKPGGRFAVSDVVTKGELPPALLHSMEAWVGCIAGALSETSYRDKLTAAGFENVDVEVTRVYNVEEARTFLSGDGLDVDAQTQGKLVSAFVRASKPRSCCGPSCCA